MFFFAQKMVILFHNSVSGKIQFSQKSLTNRREQRHALSQQVLVQQTPIISCCYYKPPHEAAIPEKETKILKNGPNTRPSKRVIVFLFLLASYFSGMRSGGDINDLKFLIRFFEIL